VTGKSFSVLVRRAVEEFRECHFYLPLEVGVFAPRLQALKGAACRKVNETSAGFVT
jgi:hypothetical protein